VTLFALDGTSNRLSGGPGKWTHVAYMAVARSRTLLPPRGAMSPTADTLQVQGDDVMYQRGVGSGTALDRLFGGATGWGAKARVRRAYQKICKNYANPNASAEDLTIDIIGFSRGAATALHLANVIFMMGIRAPRRRFSSLVLYRITLGWVRFRDWPRLSPAEVVRIRQRIVEVGLPNNQVLVHDDIVVPRIRFLGLYDAVSSFVLPMDTRVIDFQSYGFGFRLHAPPNVAECSHAMALDERRKSFRNVRVHPASMMRARALRSAEVGKGSLAVALVIAVWWLLDGVQPWSIVVAVGSLAVAFSHLLRGATGNSAKSAQVGERTDLQHKTKQASIERLSAVTGVSVERLTGITGVTDRAPQSAARVWFGLDPITKAMAPGVGVFFALIGLALLDWFGGFDNAGVGPWDYLSAVAWAFTTTAALAILGPALSADSTSLRTSSELVGLAARRVCVLGVVVAWVLATWWMIAVATDWWSYAFVEPWIWLALITSLCVSLAAGVVSGQRPTVSRARQSRGNPPRNTGAIDDALMVTLLGGIIVLGAWIVRRLASRGVQLDLLRWWQYLAVAAGAGVATGLARWHMRSYPSTVPISTNEIIANFSEREAREMWFRGNHTDIGGGGSPGLCDYSLQWMASESARSGLDIDLRTIKPELGARLFNENSGGVGPTMDPVIARARRLILDGDLGHSSIGPAEEPVPEDPKTMASFNFWRLLRGTDLAYDPVAKRSALSRAGARRFISPYEPRFVGVLGRVLEPNAADFEWTLESSDGQIFAASQQRSIDRWKNSN